MGKFSRGRLFLGLLVTVMIAASLGAVGEKEAWASFSVSEDAFSISNAPGYCFAMAAFSRWYYLNRYSELPLRRVLDKRAQERIARELQDFYSRNLINLQASYCNRFHGNEEASFKKCVTGLAAGEPRIVLLMNKGDRGAVLHAVLAYAWLPDGNVLRVYDPNYSGEERVIELDKGQYKSLDITYNAICFPEVLHDHKGLLRKMEVLADTYLRRTAQVEVNRSRTMVVGPSDQDLKAERYSRGPTR